MMALSHEVARVLGEQLPGSELENAEVLGEGWNATACRVRAGRTTWVVRVPKLAWAAGEIERQTCLGLRLSHLGFPVPHDWRVYRNANGDVLAGAYRFISGRPAPARGRRSLRALALDIAAFLTRLHEVPPEVAIRDCNALVIDPWEGRYRNLIAAHGSMTGPKTRSWLERVGDRLERASRAGAEHVLVHGDLSPEHLVRDDGGHVVGVLDFSGPQVTDPALDFGRLVQHWGVDFATTVLGSYDRLTDRGFEDRMGAYARLEPLRTIEAGVLRELPHWVAWGKRHLAAAAAADSRSSPGADQSGM
jgi:aminoglycoside phosphotransferase (APT) family kinase protein